MLFRSRRVMRHREIAAVRLVELDMCQEDCDHLRVACGQLRAEVAYLEAALSERARVERALRTQLALHEVTKTVGGPPPRPVPPGVWRSGPSTPPATAPEEGT